MAILNLTPDSFSDGGALPTPASAADAAERALAEGADVLDLGGESTRPGAAAVAAEEQIRRVAPAVAAIRQRVGDGPLMTVDTTRAAVAAAAMDAGADAVNDVSAGTDDPEMLALVAGRRRGIILMHRRARPADDTYSDRYAAQPEYPGGVAACVAGYLRERSAAARVAGAGERAIVVDPGLGFGKSVEQNVELIASTPVLAGLGYPLLSGLSRKSFVARLGGLPADSKPSDRLGATIALTLQHVRLGASIVRVHDVSAVAQALRAAVLCELCTVAEG